MNGKRRNKSSRPYNNGVSIQPIDKGLEHLPRAGYGPGNEELSEADRLDLFMARGLGISVEEFRERFRFRLSDSKENE